MEEPLTMGERIGKVMAHLNLNQERFAKELDTSPSRVSNTLKDKFEPNLDFIRKVVALCYERGFMINTAWLIDGIGQMTDRHPDSNAQIMHVETLELPLMDAKAQASFSENIYQDLFKAHSGKTYTIIKVSDMNYEKAVVLDIDGDSMYPTYRPGTKVIARQVSEGLIPYVTGLHAVSIKGGMFTIKRIVSNQNNLLILKADNPRYNETMQVELADVLCMFKIGETVYAPPE